MSGVTVPVVLGFLVAAAIVGGAAAQAAEAEARMGRPEHLAAPLKMLRLPVSR